MEDRVSLQESFSSRYGSPVISHVDVGIFRRTYFTHCLQCTFCNDWCCKHGVDVDLYHARRIEQHADQIEAYTGIPRGQWFTGEHEEDPGVPGGASVRTSVVDGACVFLNRAGRGCLLHAYCIDNGLDHRELKSMVDCLFPLSFYDETLSYAEDVEDGSLVCLDTGPTLYRGGREGLQYYFGAEFVGALDAIEATITRSTSQERDL